jgi:hypothetical protein
MRFAKVMAVLALLGLGAAASAQDYVAVERKRSPAGILVRDTIAGVVLGSAVAGGIIFYNVVLDDEEDYDWGRTLAWGAFIGLGAGLVLGAVDASTAAYAKVSRTPVRDGFSRTLDQRRRDQSGTQLFGLMARRF